MTEQEECRLDMAYAEGVRACLRRLYAAGARRDEHDRAWEDCEAMWRNRMNAVFAARQAAKSQSCLSG